jgi:hypothetical protein
VRAEITSQAAGTTSEPAEDPTTDALRKGLWIRQLVRDGESGEARTS